MNYIDWGSYTDKQWKLVNEKGICTYFVPAKEAKNYIKFSKEDAYISTETDLYVKYTNMYCCGMLEVGVFAEFDDSRFKKLDKWLTDYVKSYYGCGEQSISVICTLSEDQENWWKVVERAGYKCIHKWSNANSDNVVKLFVKEYFVRAAEEE